jgi:18S rRNA (guanine1575-N7)-methyltransferase
MVMGGRIVFQFYPEGKDHIEMLTTSAMKAGFSGGLVIDNPNSTKAKKYYLVL